MVVRWSASERPRSGRRRTHSGRKAGPRLRSPGMGRSRELASVGAKTGVVAVTGSAGFLGSNLIRLLEEDDRIRRVVAIDLKPAPTGRTKTRKSTRLNSSHQIISYAVFCLKK